jgi:hypothetical protein
MVDIAMSRNEVRAGSKIQQLPATLSRGECGTLSDGRIVEDHEQAARGIRQTLIPCRCRFGKARQCCQAG